MLKIGVNLHVQLHLICKILKRRKPFQFHLQNRKLYLEYYSFQSNELDVKPIHSYKNKMNNHDSC